MQEAAHACARPALAEQRLHVVGTDADLPTQWIHAGQALSAVLEQTAVPIALQERKFGIRVGPILDRSLVTDATWVLAVKAQMPPETLRRGFPNQVKIGPVEQIRELINVALPGIAVRALPVAPRQLPYYAGTTYFELDRSGPYWAALARSGGIAIHVAGDVPGMEIECWAIRG